MVGMSIGEHSPRTNLYHQVRRFQHRNLRCRKMRHIKWETRRKHTGVAGSNTSVWKRVTSQREWRSETSCDHNTLNYTRLHKHVSTCREVMVETSLTRPSSSFRLYPSGLLSLSLTFHSLMVLSVRGESTGSWSRWGKSWHHWALNNLSIFSIMTVGADR